MNRTDICFLIETSLSANRPDYARELAGVWLAKWPGDLGIKFYLARALAGEERPKEAAAILESITQVDLEHAAAHRLLGQLQSSAAPLRATSAATAYALTGSPLPPEVLAPVWMPIARRAITALSAGQYHSARQFAETALRDVIPFGDSAAPPLISLILLKTHWQTGQVNLALPLAEGFHERWPKAIAFILCLAEGLFRLGNVHRAVELLHTASALDPAGQAVSRYWGVAHPYTDLWPQPISIPLPGPIPAEISALLGHNRLAGPPPTPFGKTFSRIPPRPATKTIEPIPAETPSSNMERLTVPAFKRSALKQPKPEELLDIQKRLNDVAAKLSQARSHRRPAHVILYSANLLFAKFGPQGSAEVIGLIEQLGKVTARHHAEGPVVLLAPDDPAKLSPHSLTTVYPGNAWAIKMLLHDLDRQLARQGKAIGSLLIIGGDDLLPFHRLPNPTDDVDDDIPSDNPYGTLDENYFIPDWPVGRLPSPCGNDPEPLRRLLRATIAAHRAGASAPHLSQIRSWLVGLFHWRKIKSAPSSVGYSANIWKDAALEVFAPIGSEKQLHTSPPLDTDSAPTLNKAELSYFNLHGIEDSPDWFGQRDYNDNYGPLYPVALKPVEVARDDTTPRLIFTEACYGANILNKTEPDAAMCLRFLNSGAIGLVGSTKIAYGSVATPLIGADLLGRLFWEGCLAGFPFGEALRRAKLNLAQTMHKRQSFLDGEDQKTLISFVLYGDPLLPGVNALSRPRRTARNAAKSPVITEPKVMEYESADEGEIKVETVAEIKSMLAHYLPGAESAEVHLSRPLTPLGRSAKNTAAPTHRVYTLAKMFRANTHRLPVYARVTVNKSGKVVKVALSR